MKEVLIIICLLFASANLSAQDRLEDCSRPNLNEASLELHSPIQNLEDSLICEDIIVKRNGKRILCHVAYPLKRKIIYEKCDDPIQRQLPIRKRKIERIVYANGEVERFNDYERKPPSAARQLLTLLCIIVGGILLFPLAFIIWYSLSY